MDFQSAPVQLVATSTSDGCRLDGALQLPRSATENTMDGVILVHGVGGNFYGSTLLGKLAEVLLDVGYAVLRINTRGHDGVSTTSTAQGGKLQGAAYEIVDDCRLDLQAWIEFLTARGCRRIVLLGHSLGAIKIIYSQARLPQRNVMRLVAISPPRLSYSRFLQGTQREAFEHSLTAARHWMDIRQPQMLFQATFPFPLILSAGTYIDKYGPDERYNFLPLASQVFVPVDFVFGGQELSSENSAFDAIDREILAASWPAGYSMTIIPGANHFYAGCGPELRANVLSKLQD